MSEGNELDQEHNDANGNRINILRNRKALPRMGMDQGAEEKAYKTTGSQ